MKKKSLFKSKTQMILYTLIFIICIALFIIIGKTDFNKYEESEQQKFSTLYNLVDKNNLYVFANHSDILNIVNGKSGIILLGFPSNKYTNYIADILNDVCQELKVDKIYYYDFLKDRDESNGTYETIVKKLKMYVNVDDEGISNFYAPTVIVVKNGEVIAFFDDATIVKGNMTPEIYFTEYKKGELYEQFKLSITEYLE